MARPSFSPTFALHVIERARLSGGTDVLSTRLSQLAARIADDHIRAAIVKRVLIRAPP
jgi:hypothetical protein